MRRRWLYILIALALTAAGIGIFVYLRQTQTHREIAAPPKPEAPPDLEKLRGAYDAGLDAIHRGDGREAVRQFSSFTFGKRAVDEYRLYYLANGYQLANDSQRARDVLASLWARKPKMIAWIDAGLNLGNLYASFADWRSAGDIFAAIAERAPDPNVGAQARWSAVESRFYRGDVAAALADARALIVNNPKAKQ